jgi:hypothetical protein
MRIRNFMAVGLLWATTQVGLVQAAEPTVVANISGGWREDHITTKIHSFSSSGSFLGSDELKFKDLNIGEVGGQAYVDYCGWFLQLEGYAGWGSDGKIENRSNGGSCSDIVRGKAHNVETADFDVGAGYLVSCDMFDTWCGGAWSNCMQSLDCGCDQIWWGIGPVAGWSYDWMRIKGRRFEFEGSCLPIRNSTKFQWQGPWLGFDFAFQYNEFSFNLGYEYHWAHFHNTHKTELFYSTPIEFKDSRRSKDASGNVVFLDGRYQFWCNWDIGLGVKWSEYDAPRHCSNSSCDGEAISSVFDEVKSVKWYSTSVTVDLGYAF